MKKILFILSLVLCIFMWAGDSNAQINIAGVELYTLSGVGSIIASGSEPIFTRFVGINKSIYTDTLTGLRIYGRVLYNDSNDDEQNDIHGLSGWQITQKTLGLLGKNLDLYAAFGVGVSNDIVSSVKLSTKFELGLDIKNNIGVALGIDFIPSRLENVSDKKMVYLLLDWFPKL